MPSKNSTVPLGVPPAPLVFVTVAVKRTASPKVEALSAEATAVLVTASTAWVRAPLLSAKTPVPVKTAWMA